MYLIGYDIGSSSVKACVVDAQTGKTLGTAFYPKQEAPILSLKADGGTRTRIVVELPEKRHGRSHGRCRRKGRPTGRSPERRTGRHRHQLPDARPGMRGPWTESPAPAIIWCDSRAVPYGQKAMETLGTDFCLGHLLNSPGNFTASKLAWVKEHEPEIYEKIDKIMLPGDYIAMRLTGTACTTVSGLSEGMFWDFKNNCVCKELMEYYGFGMD